MAFEDLDFFGQEDPADKNYWLITFPSLKTSTEYDFKFKWVFSDSTLNDKVGTNWGPIYRHLTKSIGLVKSVENLRADYKTLDESTADTEGWFRVRFTHDNSLSDTVYDNTGITYYKITLQALSGNTSRTRTIQWSTFDASNANKVFSLDSVTHQDLFRDANGQGWVTQFRVTVVAVSKTGKESTPVTVDSGTYVSPLQKPVYGITGGPYGYTINISNFTTQVNLIGTIWVQEIVTNETSAPAANDPRWSLKQHIVTNPITISTYPSIDYRWVRLVLVDKLSDPYSANPILSPLGDPVRVKPNDPVADNSDTTAPAVPTVTAGTITYNSIQVSISTSDTDTKGIRLRYKKSSESLYQTDIIASTTFPTSYTISGLDPNSAYNISAAAYDDANNLSAYSSDITATTSTVTVSPVTNVQVKGGTYSVIGTWTAPVSPPTRIDQYKVELYNSLNSLIQTLYTYSTTVTFVGLSAGTTYYIKVHSIDIYGNQSAATPSGNVTLNASGSASDGVVPSSNPTPIINPLYRALEIKWTAVANADPVTYDVHISKTNGFTPTYSTTSNNTLALRTTGTFAVIKTMPDPVNIELEAPPTIYYIKIIARDYDGASAAAVPQASSTTSLVNNGDIATNAISANQIQAGSINSDKVLSSELLVDKVFTIGGKRAAISSATVSGGNIVYTTSGTHGFLAQSLVTVTALSPSTFNVSEVQITAVTTNTFTVTNTTGATGSSTGTGTAIAIGKSAIKIDSGSDPYRLYSGAGSYGTTATPFYLDTNGRFSLKDRLFFDGNTTLTVKGIIEASSGNFVGAMTVNNGAMKIGTDAGGTGNDGIYVNANNYWYSSGNIKIGGASNNVTWNGTSLVVTGEINAASGLVTGNFGVTTGTLYVGATNTTSNNRILINSGGIAAYPSGSSTANFELSLSGSVIAKNGTIGGWTITNSPSDLIYKNSIFLDAANSAIYAGNKDSLAAGLTTSTASGDVALWAGSSFANRGAAPFRVTLGGAVTMTNATITGSNVNTDISTAQTTATNAQNTANTANTNATNATNTANTASATATTAKNTADSALAKANTSLQTGGNAVINATNQITTISSSGIKITGSTFSLNGSGTSTTATSSSLVLNSAGITATDPNGVVRFLIDTNGNATFSGALSAATGTFSGSVSVSSGTKSAVLSSSLATLTLTDTSTGFLSGGAVLIQSGSEYSSYSARGMSVGGSIFMGYDGSSSIYIQGGATTGIRLSPGAGLGSTTYNVSVEGHLNAIYSISSGLYSASSTDQTDGAILTSSGAVIARRFNAIPIFAHKFSASGTTEMIRLVYNGADAGGINTTAAGSPGFRTLSDYRLKTNIQDFNNASNIIKATKLRSFNMNAEPDKTLVGFVAHEFAEAAPDLVVGEKDAIDSDGNPEYQSIVTTNLIPYLTGALKESILKIEQLEARLDALEG